MGDNKIKYYSIETSIDLLEFHRRYERNLDFNKLGDRLKKVVILSANV